MSTGPFVTAQELVEFFGEREVHLAVTGGARDAPTEISDPVLQMRIDEALRDASGLIASIIDVTKVDESALKNWCRDVSFYRLGRTPKSTTNEMRRRYEDAMEQLKLVAQSQRAARRDDKELTRHSMQSLTVDTSGSNPWDGI
jgi:phage gp36-like protein